MDMIENKNEVIITGDVNINLLKINEKYIFCEFLKSLISHSYFPKITFPSKFSRTSGTLTSVKLFERSNGLDNALYKNYLYLFVVT